MQFHIATMECGGCARGVMKALHLVDPHAQIDTDLASRTVTVTSGKTPADFLPALAAAGFPAEAQTGGLS